MTTCLGPSETHLGQECLETRFIPKGIKERMGLEIFQVRRLDFQSRPKDIHGLVGIPKGGKNHGRDDGLAPPVSQI